MVTNKKNFSFRGKKGQGREDGFHLNKHSRGGQSTRSSKKKSRLDGKKRTAGRGGVWTRGVSKRKDMAKRGKVGKKGGNSQRTTKLLLSWGALKKRPMAELGTKSSLSGKHIRVKNPSVGAGRGDGRGSHAEAIS